MYTLVRPLIFRMSPEAAHHKTIQALHMAGATRVGRWMLRSLFQPTHQGPTVSAFGLQFPNPVGLAAGYDKDALGWRGLAELGFGHIEIGTVTTLPQAGKPSPRLFRLVEDEAVINRMGFPNDGSAVIAQRLQGPRPRSVILGVNIGKHIDTSLEEAVGDYLALLRIFAPLADYLTINVSSPNTPGLRSLQSRHALEELLRPLDEERRLQEQRFGRRVPLLVKLAPDLASDELDDALDVILSTHMDGLIASNTTIRRNGLKSARQDETGGLSGTPIKRMSTEFVRRITRRTNGRLPIIASGGIMRPDDVQEKLDAGAVLIQLFSGLIYQGPGLVKQILDQVFAPSQDAPMPAPTPAPAPQGVPGLLPGQPSFTRRSYS